MKDFRKINPNRLHWYNATDVLTTHALAAHQKLTVGVFESVWRNLWNPALDALGQVERWGALLDVPNVQRYDAALVARSAEKMALFSEDFGVPEDFNPRSPIQLADLLFKTHKMQPLAVSKKTGVPSTSEEILSQLADKYPAHSAMLRALMDLRADLDARSRAGLGLLKYIGYDGRVHTKYKIIRSGRLSSSKPNLQNMKGQEDDDAEDAGRLARGCWVAPEGYVVVSADYSQNELRVAADLSGDQKMADALDDSDFHKASAQGIFLSQEVAKWQRRVGKFVNFGIIFGQTPDGLMLKLNSLPAADRNGIVFTKPQAQKFIDGFLKTYPKFAKWRRARIREAFDTGQSFVSFQGYIHRRVLMDTGYPDEKPFASLRKHAENVAVNNPIQYVANLFGLVALTRVVAWILDAGIPAEVALTVHDSLVLYVRRDVWQEVATTVKAIMLDFPMAVAKLKVDVEMGERDYGDMSKVDL